MLTNDKKCIHQVKSGDKNVKKSTKQYQERKRQFLSKINKNCQNCPNVRKKPQAGEK
jgi:hypothetical protein